MGWSCVGCLELRHDPEGSPAAPGAHSSQAGIVSAAGRGLLAVGAVPRLGEGAEPSASQSSPSRSVAELTGVNLAAFWHSFPRLPQPRK